MHSPTKSIVGGTIALAVAFSTNAIAQPYPGPPPGSVTVQKFSTSDLKDAPLSDEQMKAAVDDIEAHVQMPTGAQPLERYARYYAQDKTKGFIHGVYVLADGQEKAGIHIVDFDPLPVISDGRCNVIDVTFIRKIHALRAACHGAA